MTDNVRGAGGPPGPPWSVDVLADLHAGLLPEAEAARLWPRVSADPQARAVLDALESVRSDLNHLGNAPVEPMPAQFAARLDAAIQTELRTSNRAPAQPAVAPVVSLDAARKRRNRRLSWSVGLVAAAAAALAITVTVLPSNDTTDGVAEPGDTTGQGPAGESPDGNAGEPPLALSGPEPKASFKDFAGKQDYGPFGSERALMECIDAHGIEHADLIGAREATLDGKEGVAALLGAGEAGHPGKFTLVIVSPDCTADDPGELMGKSTIGR